MNTPQTATQTTLEIWRRALPYALLFGSVYFVQGFTEPTAGLISQATVDRWTTANFSPTRIGYWMGIVGLPWSIKPIVGLLIDFLPIGRLGRSGWLLLGNLLAVAGYLAASIVLMSFGGNGLVAALLLASSGVAIADVATDALAVSRGQPLGITGQLQSVQWAAISLAGILAGELGGRLAAANDVATGTVLCIALSIAIVVLQVVLHFRQSATIVPATDQPTIAENVATPDAAGRKPRSFDQAILELRRAACSRVVITTGLFLLLWNFNPFSTAVLQSYSTEVLKLDETFYGRLQSIQSITMFLTACCYGLICPLFPMRRLVHLSVVAGIASTLCYWFYTGETSGVIVTLFMGAAYMLGTMIQLDLAARIVPIASAATMFSLLMAISNLGISGSYSAGGFLYDWLFELTGSRHTAFHLLVAIGGSSTALCWFILPFLPPIQSAADLAKSSTIETAPPNPS